jgi:hypothetical protein
MRCSVSFGNSKESWLARWIGLLRCDVTPVEGTRALGPELAQVLKVLTAYTLRMTLYSY